MSPEYRPCRREDMPALRGLWKEAFGDSDRFLDLFYGTAFATDRCRVAAGEDTVLAALYWFDCACGGQRMAYIYAVATAQAARGRGIATALLKDTQRHLEIQGVRGLILVPGTASLVRFYAPQGFVPCAPQGRIKADAAGPALPLKPVSPRRYGELRRELLPEGGVTQEGVSLDFLAAQMKLYAGKDLLLAAATQEDGSLLASELLCGNPVTAAPRILKALRVPTGIFRVPYPKGRPFALFKPLSRWQGSVPQYFAFAFD